MRMSNLHHVIMHYLNCRMDLSRDELTFHCHVTIQSKYKYIVDSVRLSGGPLKPLCELLCFSTFVDIIVAWTDYHLMNTHLRKLLAEI